MSVKGEGTRARQGMGGASAWGDAWEQLPAQGQGARRRVGRSRGCKKHELGSQGCVESRGEASRRGKIRGQAGKELGVEKERAERRQRQEYVKKKRVCEGRKCSRGKVGTGTRSQLAHASRAGTASQGCPAWFCQAATWWQAHLLRRHGAPPPWRWFPTTRCQSRPAGRPA